MADYKVSKKAWNDIGKRLEKLMKKRIIDLGLIDTGEMRDHTFVIPDYEGGFTIDSTAYFKFLDKGTKYIDAYDISDYVLNSKEFNDDVEKILGDDYGRYIDIQINNL